MKRRMNNNIKVEGSGEMKRWGKKKGWRKCKYLKKKISECKKKKNYRKIGNKKEIYIDVKTNKDENVKLIIYLYIYIYL